MANWPSSLSTNASLYVAVNALQTTLASLINNSVGTIPLTSTTGFPTAGAVTIDNEVIFYTGISGANLTGCVRGSDGTTAASHNAGVPVGATVVAIHHNGLKDEVIAIETDLNARFGFGSTAITVPSGVALDVSSTGGATFHTTINLPSLTFPAGGQLATLSGSTPSLPFILQNSALGPTGSLYMGYGVAYLHTATALTATDNTAFGTFSLAEINGGNSCSAFGSQALTSNTTGFENSAFGAYTLGHVTIGASNDAFGFQTLYNLTTGNNNAAFGEQALRNLTTGSGNTAVGFAALETVAGSWTYNTAVGYSALGVNQNSDNTAVGASCLFSNTTGHLNTAVGKEAGKANIIGNRLAFFGYQAGFATLGDNNTALGDESLHANISGIENLAAGTNALANSLTSFNTAVGAEALVALTSGVGNTALGYNAGTVSPGVITGSYNLLLGYQATVNGSAFTNAIAIGKNALVTSSNTCQIGGATGSGDEVTLITDALFLTNTANQLGFMTIGAGRVFVTTASQAADRHYSIPDGGANGSFVLNVGSRTIAGATIFSAPVEISATSAHLQLDTSTNPLILQASPQATATRTWSIPDILGNGTFAALEGTQTFSGAKTHSATLTMSGATIAMGSNKITGLAAATANGDALRYEQLFGGDVTLTGNLIFNPTTKGVKGTTTNDSATAGNVGEILESKQTTPTNFATSSQYGDLTSKTLTAGEWLIDIVIDVTGNGAVFTDDRFGLGTVSGNDGTGLQNGDTASHVGSLLGGFSGDCIAGIHVQLTGSTTYYLKYYATYTGGPPQATGRITALRIR